MSISRIAKGLAVAAGAVLAMVALSQCASAESFTITSTGFKDGGMLATKNAGNTKTNPNCVGENVSPQLSWTNVPAGTKSFALLMIDPEGRGGLGVIHWVAYGIPADVKGFAEGEVSKEGPKYIGGKSNPGVPHYFGPCTPPNTGYHHYTFTLIATDLEPSAFKPGLSLDEVKTQLTGHTKGAAGIVGLFGKP